MLIKSLPEYYLCLASEISQYFRTRRTKDQWLNYKAQMVFSHYSANNSGGSINLTNFNNTTKGHLWNE